MDKNINMNTIVKYSLAFIIIVMGAYGYHEFFSSKSTGVAVWLIIALFVIIEAAILLMTSESFSNAIKEKSTVSFGLSLALITMWMISAVGIDQTIWSMVESKYHQVKQAATSIDADRAKEQLLTSRIINARENENQAQLNIIQLTKEKITLQKNYDKVTRKLTDTIWNNGKRCDVSVDCSDRKTVVQNALNLAKDNLNAASQSIKLAKNNALINTNIMVKATEEKEAIISRRVKFEKENGLTIENKKEEALIHVGLMNLMNKVFSMDIETPERAYVMALSFVVYPIYILFVLFVSTNTPAMRDLRRQKQENTKAFSILSLIGNYLKKLVIYTIKTRTRKVRVVEKEVEIEVIKEIETIVYKDGKEIVEVKIKEPHIIEQEKIVLQTVEKPIIVKEYVIVPAGTDLNILDELTGGVKPKTIEELHKESNKSASTSKGFSFDKHTAA